MFLRIGVEKSGRQISNDFDVEAAEVRKMAHRVDVQRESVDNIVQDIYGIQGGVSDGAQVTPTNYLYQADRFKCSGDEQTSRPMASDFDDITRS